MHLLSLTLFLLVKWSTCLQCTIHAQWKDKLGNSVSVEARTMPDMDVVNIANNDPVTITCISHGPVTFQIHVKNSDSDSARTYYNGDKLVMSGAHFVPGRYRCECKMDAQKSSSAEVFLAAVPQFAHSQQSLWATREGHNVTLPCSITNALEGVTYNTTWQWRNGSGDSYTMHQSYSVTNGQRDLVVVRPSARSTKLIYECIVVGVHLKSNPSIASNLFGIHPSSGSHQLTLHKDPPLSLCELLGCQGGGK